MKRVAATFLPPIALDYGSKTPIYGQLYEWFRQAIFAAQLRPGQRVPSTRSLATELKVSRIPVLNAYAQLLAEGYFESFVGAGTCVARSIPEDTLIAAARKARRGSPEKVERRGPRRMSRRGASLTQLPAQTWLDNLGAFRVSLPPSNTFQLGSGQSWWPDTPEGRREASWHTAVPWGTCHSAKSLRGISEQFVAYDASHRRSW
jgi:GntR family transcriptional regulator/MocR family aminotransferase